MRPWFEKSPSSRSKLKPYQIRTPADAPSGRPRVIHALANFHTGGSSRLVVDLIENLGHLYDQEVITSHVPDPPAYVGVNVVEFPGSTTTTEDILGHLHRSAPRLLHVHYWGDVDRPWYAKVIGAAERSGCAVIENVNTPVEPYYSDAVRRYVYVSEYVQRTFSGSSRTKALGVVVHPGCDFRLFDRGEDRPLPTDCIGMVYRLESDKLNEQAIDVFVKVVRQRPNTKVLIVGGGTLLPHYKKMARAAGVLERFRFTDYVAYEELPQLYSELTVFVAPVWQESFGQVTPFAMHMGIPVAGYDVGALSEILGRDDLLAPPGDSDALARIVVDLLDDPAKRQAVGSFNRTRAAALFALESMVSRYRTLYAEVLGAPR